MKLFAPHSTDYYKVGHKPMFTPGTQVIYSNFTPRSDRLATMTKDFDHKVVNFGLQGTLKELNEMWYESFFSQPREKVLARYKRRLDTSLGPDAVNISHLGALHDLGYLPIEVKALPEGSRVNIRVPLFTIKNTLPEFFWLTNYLETVLSDLNWKSVTVATIAYEYKRMLDKYAILTGGALEFVPWQGHDFSARGMSGPEDSARTSAGHLAVGFTGTDTISAIDYLEDYYNANSETELVGGSVPASEHSVMCSGGKSNEVETIKRLISEVVPSGVVSVVSDTWDYFNVITKTALELKNVILNRPVNALGLSKVVFRPDSGDPTLIVCGNPNAVPGSSEYKGSVECLWEIFGGSVNSKGYKELNPRVGLIYGDSITLQRAEAILSGLAEKGYSSSNIVFGVGSFTYNYMTRDTFGFAVKATYSEVDGVSHNLSKDPVTDNGTKKSAEGLLRVEKVGNDFVLFDKQTKEQEQQGELKTVYLNGKLVQETSLSEIRARLK